MSYLQFSNGLHVYELMRFSFEKCDNKIDSLTVNWWETIRKSKDLTKVEKRNFNTHKYDHNTENDCQLLENQV